MQSHVAMTLLLLFTATGASAQSSRTSTVDSPNFSGSRTTTIDPATGTASRDGTVVRKSDGAVATRSVDRTRTDSGVTIEGNASNFAGETRSVDYARTRTDTGSTATGSFTRRNGETLTYQGSSARGDGSFATQQQVTGANGQSLYARTATSTRTEAGINRSVNTTRATGFRPRASVRGARRR